MEDFKIIAFTHKNLSLELVGRLHLTTEDQTALLGALKLNFGFEELMYLSTCNRVELLIRSAAEVTPTFIKELALFINSRLNNKEADELSAKAEVFEGEESVAHLMRVASSIDSLVVGEREIISQVRKAYDYCNMLGLTGDFTRLLVKHTIETAKEIYTKTGIAKNPVSIVSLAYRQLKNSGIKNNARIVFVGSGETNSSMATYLQKHKFANFTVFNRTLENARSLAKSLGGKAYGLDELKSYKEGFDVLIVCTASNTPVISPEIYTQLLANESGKKIIIDLGLPSNVDVKVSQDNKKLLYIDINSLKEQAETNLRARLNEIEKCEEIIRNRTTEFHVLHRERRIELAFGEIPRQVKAIKELALNEVFVKEINGLDQQGREVIDRILSYVEKKYNAVAIKTAKEVLLNQKS